MTQSELYEKLLEVIPSTEMSAVVNPIKGSRGSSETVGVMCKIIVPVSEKKKALDKVVDYLLNEGLPCWVDKVDMEIETFFVMFNDTIE